VKTYEITYLTVVEEGNDAKSIASFLSSHGSKIISVHPWGNRRKLTYPIKKQDQAFFTTVVFESEPSSIATIQHELHLSDEVLRTLIVEFEPGVFHRTPQSEEGARAKPAEKIEPPIASATEPISPDTQEPSTPIAAVKEAPEEQKSENAPEEKPKRRRTTKKTALEEKSLDEKLDALLNEDITK
jgi:ribosomal protein S6